MQLVPLTSIEVRARQRKTMSIQGLADLRESILSPAGLLHPPIAYWDAQTKTWVLVVGERRLRAVQQINERSPVPEFNHGSTRVQPGFIPITPLAEYLTDTDRFEAELNENIHREEISWPDRVQALNALHEMRRAANPEQTFVTTAREIAKDESQVSTLRQEIRAATIIAPHLSNPTIAKARKPEEALSLIYQQEEHRVRAALARRFIGQSTAETLLPIDVRHADLSQLLPTMEPNQFDLVIADPPYGIDAGSRGARQRSIQHHNYADDPDVAREVAQDIIREGFRLTKPRANLFLFCDIDLFPWLKQICANCGWVPFRRPLIWQKSDSEGLFPWGSQGPRITTEFILYATKGQRGLVVSPIDVLHYKRVARNERVHGAEKPIELMKRLIECATLAGERILDPCCGSGSSIRAARLLGRSALGIEKDKAYYETAMANVFEAESEGKGDD